MNSRENASGDWRETPLHIAQRTDLTRAEKIQILKNWEYDARELSVAVDEGMGANGATLLPEIHAALGALGAAVNLDDEPPTKQGGAIVQD